MNINITYKTMNFKILACFLFFMFSVLHCTDDASRRKSPAVVEAPRTVPCLTRVDPQRLDYFMNHTSHWNVTYYYKTNEQLNITCDDGGKHYEKLKWEHPIGETKHRNHYNNEYNSRHDKCSGDNLNLNSKYDNSTGLCEYTRKSYNYTNCVKIYLTFVSISEVQYFQLQGLDTKRLTLVKQTYKAISYIYEFYDEEEINATCAQKGLNLYWQHFYPSLNSKRITTKVGNSSIIYNKTLSRSDNGSSLICRSRTDERNYSKKKTNYPYFSIQLSIKIQSDFYSLDRESNWKILIPSPNEEPIYEYHNGETVSLKCKLKRKNSPKNIPYHLRWNFKSAMNTSRDNLTPYKAPMIIYNATLEAADNGSVLLCETYENNRLYSIDKVKFRLINSGVHNSSSIVKLHEKNSFKIGIVILIAIILLILAVSVCLIYRCHHKDKTNVTPIHITQTSNANNSQTCINPTYDQSAGSKPLEDVAYEPCYDEIGQVITNSGQLSYANVEFGKELYAKPTPKALRQNNKIVIYAQVLPKNERHNAVWNDNETNANEDGGYYNMFENESYMNSKTKAEYADPCYAECSKN